jgi:predicted alpha-1,2-mannosidase
VRAAARTTSAAALAAGLVLGILGASPARAGVPDVDSFVGTGGRAPWFSGNTTPAAARPFGMVQLGPDTTADGGGGRPSTTATGYAAADPLLRGFSPTHLSGVGCPAFGDVPLLPVTGPVPDDPAAATVGLGRQDAGPGWYRTTLANGVTASLAAADRAGLASFTFPAGPRARLLVKAAGGLAGVQRATVSFPSAREVAVSATSGGFCGSPGHYRVHVLYRFDRAVTGRGTWGAAARRTGSVTGADVGGWVAFGTGGTVRAQVGVSFVDLAGARRNLADAAPGWSVGRLRDAAATVWERELGRVAVTGGSAGERAVLDTALYHVLLHPMTLSDADGRYPGFDGVVHRVASGHRHYTAIPGWDAYRSTVPLLAWLRPDVASDLVGSLQRAADEGGWLPRWPLVASYTGVMNGDSAAPVIAAAHAFGGRGFDVGRAVTQLARQGRETDGAPGQGWFRPRPGLAEYLRLGYVPNTTPERGWSQPHGASTTLEYALDDFAVSRLAVAAGRPAVADEFRRRSGSWRSLLDPDRGLLLPRDATGALPGPGYDPASCCDGFQEGNAVQYSWMVPQDMAGLLASLGPRAEVARRLDDFHAQLNAGAGRPYAWLGNQVSFATPWADLWLGRPARASDTVARARRELWALGPDGLVGNEDLGSLSAWYVLASLGVYPLTPGTADVGLTTPAFPDVTVRPRGGPATRIVRTGTGAHISSVRVDGRERTASWLSLGPGARPARVDVATTDDAAPAWGTGVADVPPSYPAP